MNDSPMSDSDRRIERKLIEQARLNDDAASVLTDFYEQRGFASRAALWKWIHDARSLKIAALFQEKARWPR
jgi:hypothetical protein